MKKNRDAMRGMVSDDAFVPRLTPEQTLALGVLVRGMRDAVQYDYMKHDEDSPEIQGFDWLMTDDEADVEDEHSALWWCSFLSDSPEDLLERIKALVVQTRESSEGIKHQRHVHILHLLLEEGWKK